MNQESTSGPFMPDGGTVLEDGLVMPSHYTSEAEFRLDVATGKVRHVARIPRSAPSCMPLDEALRLTLSVVTGRVCDEETAADVLAGLNAAGWMLAPFSSGECICRDCGLRHSAAVVWSAAGMKGAAGVPANQESLPERVQRSPRPGIGHPCARLSTGTSPAIVSALAHLVDLAESDPSTPEMAVAASVGRAALEAREDASSKAQS